MTLSRRAAKAAFKQVEKSAILQCSQTRIFKRMMCNSTIGITSHYWACPSHRHMMSLGDRTNAVPKCLCVGARWMSTCSSRVHHPHRCHQVVDGITSRLVRTNQGVSVDMAPRWSPRLYSTAAPLEPEVQVDIKTMPDALDSISTDKHTFASMNLNKNIQMSLNTVFKYETMSDVQYQVLKNVMNGHETRNLLVRAKTGTGKTLAFLIAAIERLMQNQAHWDMVVAGKRGISILIISPTRELALQIKSEAEKVCRFLPLRVGIACGGESRSYQENALRQKLDILVATPGRLIDFLSSNVTLNRKLQDNRVLILDEADRLLELGFREDLYKIRDALPARDRDTLLFSATLGRDTRSVANDFTSSKYDMIDCVPKDQVDSHLKIRQTYVRCRPVHQLALLYDIIKQHQDAHPHSKIMVFFNTAAMVNLFAQVFDHLPGLNVMQLHSRLSQSQRTQISFNYRQARSNAILFTTDVSARGVDYPGVTLVIQFGPPTNSEDYIHRVGRTGRAGKDGEAILLLAPYELAFVSELQGLPIRQDVRFKGHVSSGPANQRIVDEIQKLMSKVPQSALHEAFSTWQGSSKGYVKRFKLFSSTYAAAAKEFAEELLGLKENGEKKPRLSAVKFNGFDFKTASPQGGARHDRYRVYNPETEEYELPPQGSHPPASDAPMESRDTFEFKHVKSTFNSKSRERERGGGAKKNMEKMRNKAPRKW